MAAVAGRGSAGDAGGGATAAAPGGGGKSSLWTRPGNGTGASVVCWLAAGGKAWDCGAAGCAWYEGWA